MEKYTPKVISDKCIYYIYTHPCTHRHVFAWERAVKGEQWKSHGIHFYKGGFEKKKSPKQWQTDLNLLLFFSQENQHQDMVACETPTNQQGFFLSGEQTGRGSHPPREGRGIQWLLLRAAQPCHSQTPSREWWPWAPANKKNKSCLCRSTRKASII